MITEEFKLSELLSVVTASHRCGIEFLNLNFKPKRGVQVPGPGIYGLLFTPPTIIGGTASSERLIYVGKYRGTKRSPFGGNAISQRWWAHAASMTMRGHRLHVSNRTIAELQASINDDVTGVSSCLIAAASSSSLSKDHGCLAPLNRIKFALSYWQFFASATPEEILYPFRVAYVRIPPSAQMWDTDSIRAAISSVETALIQKFRPICNSEIKSGSHREDVGSAEFKQEASSALSSLEL